MGVKYKNLKLFTLMNKQQKLLKNGISEFIKQEKKICYCCLSQSIFFYYSI